MSCYGDECQLAKQDPAFAKVPVIIIDTGIVLQHVKASPEFHKKWSEEKAKALKKLEKKRTGSDHYSGWDSRPLPSQRHLTTPANIVSANPHPCKRQHEKSLEVQVYPNVADVDVGQLYTISQSESDGQDYNDEEAMKFKPQPVGFQARRLHVDPNSSHCTHSYMPPSFQDIAHGRHPPPSAQSLNPHPIHSSSHMLAHSHTSAHATLGSSTHMSSQPAAGSSHLGLQPQVYGHY